MSLFMLRDERLVQPSFSLEAIVHSNTLLTASLQHRPQCQTVLFALQGQPNAVALLRESIAGGSVKWKM